MEYKMLEPKYQINFQKDFSLGGDEFLPIVTAYDYQKPQLEIAKKNSVKHISRMKMRSNFQRGMSNLPIAAIALVCSVLCGLLLNIEESFSQTKPITFGGGISLSTEFNSSSGDDSNYQPRSPENVSRAVIHTTITLFDQVQLPFEAYITTYSKGYRDPFNQFGVSPKLTSWLRLHGGYFSARTSDFTFGDVRMLGGGVEATPGKFRLGAYYGSGRRSAEADSASGFNGEYLRMMTAARIGYGDESGTYINLNFLHAKDDTNSVNLPGTIDQDGQRLFPESKENYVGSLNFGLGFSNLVRVQAEIGMSMTTHDLRLESRDGFLPQTDYAGKISFFVTPNESWNVMLNTQWIGPGFFTLGYAQMPNDQFEITLAPTVRLNKSNIYLRGSIGYMFNNLRSNRISTTTRLIGSLSASIQTSDQFGFEAQYSNYGMQSSHVNDSLRVQFISQNISLSPHYSFDGLGGTNMLSASYNLQDMSDQNQLATDASHSIVQSLSTVHSLSFQSSLNLSTSIMYNHVDMPTMKTAIYNVSETIGYSFFENQLSTSFSIGYNIVNSNNASDGQFTGRLTLGYSFEKFGTISFNLSNNRYRYDSALNQPSFDEWNGSLQYSVGF